jgi:serine/threonine protein kinase
MSDHDEHTETTPFKDKRERPVKDSGEQKFVAGDMISGVYEVISFIGSGGMSNVYKCKDISLDRIVAVKTMQSGYTAESLRRFQTEGKAIAKLEHANIVKLYGLQQGADDEPVLVMEYIPGLTLADILKTNSSLPTDRVLKITAQICEALKASEHAGIVHRDLKPSNIVLTDPGTADERVKILDFGIAKIRDNTTGDATKTGDIFGTPNYMSPEQALGKKCDARADQYALGCILFEMLSGRPPFTSENIMSVILMHIQNPPPSLSEVTTKHLPSYLASVVKKMLQKNPEDRYARFEEVAEAISKVGQRPPRSARKFALYSALPVLLVGLVLLFVYVAHTRSSLPLPVNQEEVHDNSNQSVFRGNVTQTKEASARVAQSEDQKLNTTYSALAQKLHSNPSVKAKLLNAEKAWMLFRDAHLQSIYPDEGGTAQNPFAGSMCFEGVLADITVVRTRQLARMLAGSIELMPNAKNRLSAEEKLLDEKYQKALTHYAPEDPKFLREAQVKWLAFREAESNLTAALAPPRDAEVTRWSTECNLVRQRMIELDEWARGVSIDKVCAGTRPVKQR